MHKVTFSYDKENTRFAVSGTTSHNVRVMLPGVKVDEVMITSPRPFQVKLFDVGSTRIATTLKSRPTDTEL